jgi:hypothetical protein
MSSAFCSLPGFSGKSHLAGEQKAEDVRQKTYTLIYPDLKFGKSVELTLPFQPCLLVHRKTSIAISFT